MCFLFLDPQDVVGPSISSSVVLCYFVLLVYIVVLLLVFYLCPSPVHVVATFSGTVLFPVLCFNVSSPEHLSVLHTHVFIAAVLLSARFPLSLWPIVFNLFRYSHLK